VDILKYEGLLTDAQKRAGYFVTQDEDFVFVWRSKPHPEPIAVFLYNTCRIKDCRDAVDRDMEEKCKLRKD